MPRSLRRSWRREPTGGIGGRSRCADVQQGRSPLHTKEPGRTTLGCGSILRSAPIMRAAIICIAALAMVHGARADTAYAYVPAHPEEHNLGSLTVAEAPSEGEIVLVEKPHRGRPRRTARAASSRSNRASCPKKYRPVGCPDAWGRRSPKKALFWPDAEGHINASARTVGSEGSGPVMANPWLYRRRSMLRSTLSSPAGALLLREDRVRLHLLMAAS